MSKSHPTAAALISGVLTAWGAPAVAGTAVAIANFTINGGGHPYAAVVFDSVVGRPGVLYTTASGAAGDCYEEYGCGSVVQLTPPSAPGGSWRLQTIHKFHESDGDVPYSGVVFDTFGALYGTTSHGGAGVCNDGEGCGTVFKLTRPSTPGAPWTETILYKFAGVQDGASPTGNLTFDSSGDLIGTTYAGGPTNCGTIYSLSPPKGTAIRWTKSTLFNFSCSDGARPRANLVFDTKGALYGTTEFGGAANLGTVFKLNRPAASGGPWVHEVLHSFTGSADGQQPFNSLLFDNRGAIYGTTWKGGTYGGGVVFKLTPPDRSSAAWEIDHYEFDNKFGGGLTQGGLTRDTWGVFYGTTNRGGTGDCTRTHCGTIFALVGPRGPGGAWSHTVLADLTGPNGGDPEVTPTFQLGKLYGTGDYGGAYDLGVVFEYRP